MSIARQARLDAAAMASPRHLTPAQAQEAREHAWSICKLLCGPSEGTATSAARLYALTLAAIEEREAP